MALISIPTKATNDTLTASEFDQIVDTLKSHVYDIDILSLYVGGTQVITAARAIQSITTINGLTLPSAAIIGSTETQTMTNKTLTSATLNGTTAFGGPMDTNNNNVTEIKQATFSGVVASTVSASTATIDWTSGSVQTVTLAYSASTIAFTAPSGVARLTLKVVQDASGSRTVTWPTIKWQGAAAPTLTTGANKIDILTFVYDGTSYYGMGSLNFG